MQIPGLDLLNGPSQSQDNPPDSTALPESWIEPQVGGEECKPNVLVSDRTLEVSTELEDDGNLAAGVSSSLAVGDLTSYQSVQPSILDHLDPLDLALFNASEGTSRESSDEDSGTSDDEERYLRFVSSY